MCHGSIRFISFHFGFCWPCHLNWHVSKWWSTNTHKIHQLEIWCCVLFVLPGLQKYSKGRHTNKHNLDRKKWYLLFFRALLCRELVCFVWRDEHWENRNEWSHPEAVSTPYMYNIWTAADQERNDGANDWMEKVRIWFRYYFFFGFDEDLWFSYNSSRWTDSTKWLSQNNKDNRRTRTQNNLNIGKWKRNRRNDREKKTHSLSHDEYIFYTAQLLLENMLLM